MTRPESHRDVYPDRSCSGCRHLHEVRFRGHLFCCHGDQVTVVDEPPRWTVGVPVIDTVNGIDVDIAEGDEYDEIWGDRVISDPNTEVCEHWEKREVPDGT